jgi:hypothetical protein
MGKQLSLMREAHYLVFDVRGPPLENSPFGKGDFLANGFAKLWSWQGRLARL